MAWIWRSGRIDVGFSRPMGEAVSRLGLAETPIYVDRIFAVLPDGHPLAASSAIRLNELAGEPLIVFRRQGAPRLYDLIASTVREARFSAQPNLMATVLLLVEAGFGVGLVPGCVRHLAHKGIRFRQLRPRSSPVPLVMAWSVKEDAPAVDAWRELVRERIPAIRRRMVQ